jgi:hypothetical protein
VEPVCPELNANPHCALHVVRYEDLLADPRNAFAGRFVKTFFVHCNKV